MALSVLVQMLNFVLDYLSGKWCLEKQVPKWRCKVQDEQKARIQDIPPYGYFHSLPLCPRSLRHAKPPFLLRSTGAPHRVKHFKDQRAEHVLEEIYGVETQLQNTGT